MRVVLKAHLPGKLAAVERPALCARARARIVDRLVNARQSALGETCDRAHRRRIGVDVERRAAEIVLDAAAKFRALIGSRTGRCRLTRKGRARCIDAVLSLLRIERRRVRRVDADEGRRRFFLHLLVRPFVVTLVGTMLAEY